MYRMIDKTKCAVWYTANPKSSYHKLKKKKNTFSSFSFILYLYEMMDVH